MAFLSAFFSMHALHHFYRTVIVDLQSSLESMLGQDKVLRILYHTRCDRMGAIRNINQIILSRDYQQIPNNTNS